MRQPHILNAHGPTPLLEFEVKPPDGRSVESLAEVEAELDTDRNVMPGIRLKRRACAPAMSKFITARRNVSLC